MTATAFSGSVSFPLLRISSGAQQEHRPGRTSATPTCGAESTSSSVHARGPRPSTLERGRLVNRAAVDERGDHPSLADRAPGAGGGERVRGAAAEPPWGG